MLSKTFSVMIIVSFFSAMITGNFDNMSREFVTSLCDGVTLCINILGMMCFWSGFMNVLKDAGIVGFLSKFLKPILCLVYGKNNLDKETCENLSACVSANFLGLGNAALPLGIKAAVGLEKGNKTEYAKDSTIMFCVLNTVPFQLMPTTLIAMRSAYGSVNPFDVVPYIWLCSVLINVFAVVVCRLFAFFERRKT